MRTNKDAVRGKTQAQELKLLSYETPMLVQEAYKTLRTNVMLSLPGSGCKCIGLTSPTSGDGKSTTASNLAISLAQINKRVLLIDCDMRLPTIANKFGIEAVPGLSDYLVGQARIEEVVRKVDEHGIHVLPSGNIPPDSTGLLEAEQLEHLFNAFRKIYDFVVVDLPPVTSVSDAVILAKNLDGFLLTVWQNKTKHRDVQEMIKQLQMSNTKVLGFVVTGVTVDDKKHDKYKYERYKKK